MTINYIKQKENLSNVKLEPVKKSDWRFLYQLLKQRDPRANISHKKIPTFQEHVNFVMSKPYSIWYTISIKNKKVGSIYISRQCEIGIFLEKNSQKKGIGKQALLFLINKNPRKRYLANINPKNTKSRNFFKKNGFKLIQHTYELIPPKNLKRK